MAMAFLRTADSRQGSRRAAALISGTALYILLHTTHLGSLGSIAARLATTYTTIVPRYVPGQTAWDGEMVGLMCT